MASLDCSILTPEGAVYQGEIESLTVVAADGEIGVLPGHAALITALGTGDLRIRQGGNTQHWLVFGGFMEVLKDKVVVLAEKLEHLDDMDLDQARKDADGTGDLVGAAKARIRFAKKHGKG